MDTLIATILTVLGTLGGVFLGSYLQGRSRKEEWFRQDSQRWLEQRRAQYSSFINLMDSHREAFANGLSDGSANSLSSSGLHNAWGELKLVAESDAVVRVAGQYAKLFDETINCYKGIGRLVARTGDVPPEKSLEFFTEYLNTTNAFIQGMTELTELAKQFLAEARLELGLPKLNEDSIKHQADQASIYGNREIEKQIERIGDQLRRAADEFRQPDLGAG